jgi:hypothetical protein
MGIRTIACLLLSCCLAGGAMAQTQRDRDGNAGHLGVRAGIGFTAGPGTFLTAFELPYYLTDRFSLGPLIQIGVDDRDTLVAPTLNARFAPDFGQRKSSNDFVRELAPYLQGGIGLLYLNRDVRGGDIDDTEFLFNLGLGLDFPLTERVSVGTQMLFNVIPGSALGEKFFFSWQLATVEYRF